MRALNVFAAFTVLVCNLVVSYNHSIQLFYAGGFTGWMAHVAVVGAETTFVMGALNIVVSRLRGYSPGAPAILGGLLGVALVSWSNVAAGWEYGVTGILLGLATPVSLIVAEAILSHAILQRSTRKVEAEKWSVERLEPDPPNYDEETSQPVEDAEDGPPAKLETPPNELEKSPGTLENSSQPAEDVEESVEATSQPTSQQREEEREAHPTSPYDWAVYLHEQEGTPPSRRKLMEVAGCSEWAARQALKELKKKIS